MTLWNGRTLVLERQLRRYPSHHHEWTAFPEVRAARKQAERSCRIAEWPCFVRGNGHSEGRSEPPGVWHGDAHRQTEQG